MLRCDGVTARKDRCGSDLPRPMSAKAIVFSNGSRTTARFEAGGMTMDDIVSTTVFLKDLNDFGKMNEVYATYFKDALPALLQ
jgi:hypothetical protein